jgi:hypothetical protein
MRVMVLIKASKESEAGVLPDTKMLTEMGHFNEELVKAGLMLSGEGLLPSSKGKKVRFAAGKVAVIDGPFAEAKELIAGFWLWKVKSMDEAVEWAKRIPSDPKAEPYDIELRQVGEMEDFGDALTPELKAQEDRLRETVNERSRKG